jgi:hypothetical protein
MIVNSCNKDCELEPLKNCKDHKKNEMKFCLLLIILMQGVILRCGFYTPIFVNDHNNSSSLCSFGMPNKTASSLPKFFQNIPMPYV